MTTIKDVAKLAGVGTSTVSRYLNSSGYISEEAKSRIQTACKELEYVPSELARAMKRNQTRTIGVMMPTICNPFFTELVHVIEQSLLHRGYKTVLCNTNGDLTLEKNYLAMASANCFDGIVLITGSSEVLNVGCRLPMIIIDRINCLGEEHSSITSNHKQGARLATSHLLSCGCQKIVFLASMESSIPMVERMESFQTVMQSHHAPYRIEYVEEMSATYLKQLVDDGFDGIFAWNDIAAVQCLSLCAAARIKVPEDLCLIGYDNISITELVYPKLTTIVQPIDELGDLASDCIHDLIEGNIKIPRKITIDNYLKIRDSTRNRTRENRVDEVDNE